MTPRSPKDSDEAGSENNPVGREPIDIGTDLALRRSRSSGGGGGDTIGERLSRLEGIFEGFKTIIEGIRHSQNLMLGLVSLLALILIGLSVYELQRLDQMDGQLAQTNQRVTELPGRVSDDVRNLTQTLAATITAARQPAPVQQVQPTPIKSPRRP